MGRLEAILGNPKALLGRLEAFLGSLGTALEAFWAVLERAWLSTSGFGLFGLSWGPKKAPESKTRGRFHRVAYDVGGWVRLSKYYRNLH